MNFKYLNSEVMRQTSAEKFNQTMPYPWINIQGLLTESGFEELLATFPDISAFEKSFKGGRSHDRFILSYKKNNTDIANSWHDFVDELNSRTYLTWLKQLMGYKVYLEPMWHCTPKDCSVSPHPDSSKKVGSQIFYFNTADDWRVEWGGQSLILDDGGKFTEYMDPPPTFDQFRKIYSSESIGNRSLLFKRIKTGSWHGVRPLDCPENTFRRIFIIPMRRIVRFDKKIRTQIRDLLLKPQN